jgi:hypothetical protein
MIARHIRFVALGMLIALPGTTAFAQTINQKKDAKAVKRAEPPDPIVQQAIEELSFVVDDLKQIEDLYRGLPVAQTLVKKLAPHRPDRCRELLEALADSLEEQMKTGKDKADRKVSKYMHAPNLKTIIHMAAGFDAEFAQKITERFSSEKKYAELMGEAEASYFLAKELLDNDPNRAVSIANKFAGQQFTLRALEFIGSLRTRNPQLAKTYFFTLLQGLDARKYPSIDELLYLHPYVFLSQKIPVYDAASGRMGMIANVDYGKDLENQSVDAELAKAYLTLCVKLMLQQERYAGNYGADARADLTFIAFIVPMVKQYLPAAADRLLERQLVLQSSLDPNAQKTAQNNAEQFVTADRNKPFKDVSSVEKLVEEIESKNDPPARKDKAYYDAARQAVNEQKYELALEIVEKLSVAEARAQAKDALLIPIANKEIAEGKLEAARRRGLAASEPLVKAYVLSLVADAFLEGKGQTKDLQRASEILSEVSVVAADLPPNAEKTAIAAGLAAVYAKSDGVRAIDYLRQAIQAANKLEKFNGDFSVRRVLELNGFGYFYDPYGAKLTFYEAVTKLARPQFNPLLAEAKTFTNSFAKAKTIVTICDVVIPTAEPVKKLKASTR